MNAQVQAIRSEIERRKLNYLDGSYTFFPTAMQELLEFIDSLPEETSCKGSIDKADLLRWLREVYNRAERLQADIHIEIAAKAAAVATLKNVIEYIEQR